MSTPQSATNKQGQHPLLQHDYKGLCWWCGSPADSREHRHKKSDVVRSFGPAPWQEGVLRVRPSHNYPERVQGPNSDKLKFSKVLCAKCNNAQSRPFDISYETFSEFLHKNSEEIVRLGTFRFSRIYGKPWRERRQDLAKYIVKSICCRLAEDDIKVPQSLIDYMNGARHTLPHLKMEMNINMTKYEMGVHLSEIHGINGGSLWLGDHKVSLDSNGDPIGTVSHLGFDWFNLDWGFSFAHRKGHANFFKGDVVRLPHFWPEGFVPGDVVRHCQDCKQAEGSRPTLE